MHRSLLLVLVLSACADTSAPGDGSSETDDATGEGSTTSGSETGEPGSSSSSSSSSSAAESTGSSSEGSSTEDTTGGPGSTTADDTTGALTGSSTGPVALCGDGQVDDGEVCDDGKETKLCDDDCTPVACGDAHLNKAAGEECDDGNVDETDGCRSSCLLPKCGDGMLDASEACDDGNALDGDGCDNDCTASWWENEGVAYDVEIAALKGWTLCWEGKSGASLIDGVKACQGQHLLVACAPQLEQVTLKMVAHGPRAEVIAPASLGSPHLVNGSQWVYGASWFGYSPPGVDMNAGGPLLLWGMVQYDLVGLSKCEAFNTDGTFRRLIFKR